MLTLLIAIISSIAYVVGTLFTVKSANLIQETVKRRNNLKPKIRCCFACTPSILVTNKYGFIRPWLKGTTWPLFLGGKLVFVTLKVVFVALKPLGLATNHGAKSLRDWLHPEPEIPDQDQLRELEGDLKVDEDDIESELEKEAAKQTKS